MSTTYLVADVRRTFRNSRALIFSLVLPGIFFLLFSSGDQTQSEGGVLIAPYIMVSMATYGAMNALFTGGGRIAIERSIGWNRQLRLTGMTGTGYVGNKAAVSYLTAIPGLVGVLILGYLVRSVHLSALHWVEVSLSILLGLLPVAALGVLVGYLGTPAALQPVFGLGSALLALLGGMFVPAEQFPSGVQTVMHVLPTYWSADAGRAVLRGTWVGAEGLLVLAGWTVVLGGLAASAYVRDQKKG